MGIKFIPTLRYTTIICCYLCVKICWWHIDLVMMNEVENNYIDFLNPFPAIMGWPSTSFHSCVQVGFLHISPYMFWIVCTCLVTLELLLWLANRSPHSPANCCDEYHGQTCVQRMSNTFQVVDIWSKFIGTKAKNTEDWEVKNMFESWQSRCRNILRCQ